MSSNSPSHPLVSVVIPLYKGEKTIEPVLAAAHASDFTDFEIVIVNDCSPDDSLGVLRRLEARYPHRLIDLPENMGVSKARNRGAKEARGEIILFIDADCIVLPDTIGRCAEELQKGESVCVGGVYTRNPWDSDFFSRFQSLYINHVESKTEHPDYIATHCMAIWRKTFDEFGGFITDSFIGHAASVEDVEFCHRLLKAGHQLTQSADIQVQHMFRFSFARSVTNAIKKSKYWTMYSLKNHDITKDSGAASYELKVNVFSQLVIAGLLIAAGLTRFWWLLAPAAALYLINTAVSYRLFDLMRRERGWLFLLQAAAYYQFVYAFVVAYGSFVGTLKYLWDVKLTHRYA